MKGEIQATVKCGGCGRVLFVSKHNLLEDLIANLGSTMSLGDMNCPTCADLHYGSLTVEMVAEALIARADAWYAAVPHGTPSAMQKGLATSEASFVLRLMNELRPVLGLNMPDTREEGQWRQWLLDLARKR